MRCALILAVLATPALADADDDAALALFTTSMAEACDGALDDAGQPVEPTQRFDVKVPVTSGDPQRLTLWQFRCMVGAYNITDVFFAKSDYGIQPVYLAVPDLDIQLETPDDPESKVKSLAIAGWSASPWATNAIFDPKSLTLGTHDSWRGLDDASSTGTWVLVDGHFRLTRYDVDATYDGEINPETLFTAP